MGLKQNLNEEEENKTLNENSNIIAITACLKRCSVAIKYEGKIFECNENVDAPTYLAAILQQLIHESGIDLKKIDGILTASGPGSFTGIRTAQSLTKALALALEIPATSVDYFDVIEKMSDSYEFSKNQSRILVIRGDNNQVYYRTIYRLKRYKYAHGDNQYNLAKKEDVCDYNFLTQKIKQEHLILIGEDIPGILSKAKEVNCLIINNFRTATNFFAFARKITKVSKITPMYLFSSSPKENN